ncbi:MAG: nitroreductase family protein [Candidatus Poseidoniales archaeon]|nr:nitroreductase family protein [Candidatus Poseidoniales archaeon]
MLERSQSFHARMEQRRTTRHFSGREVPRELIELAVQTAGTAPSGAHMQPLTYVAVADSDLKARMREAAEVE